jgi:hypothetical protein
MMPGSARASVRQISNRLDALAQEEGPLGARCATTALTSGVIDVHQNAFAEKERSS